MQLSFEVVVAVIDVGQKEGVRTVKKFRIVDLGFDGESFFPGHGIGASSYACSSTGLGNMAMEALDDALEQTYGDLTDEERDEIRSSPQASFLLADKRAVREHVGCVCEDSAPCGGPQGPASDYCEECAVCAGTYHRYVAIDWA